MSDKIAGDYDSVEGIKDRALDLNNPAVAAMAGRAEDRVYYDDGGYKIKPPESDEPNDIEMIFHLGVLTGAALEREYPAETND